MMALMGTPSVDSQSGSIVGHWEAGAVKRPLGWAAVVPFFLPMAGVHLSPRQSRHSAGGFSVMPSHQTPPSGVRATLVKMELRERAAIAAELVLVLVPGATPKKPASGLIARSWPFASGLSHAMSSPTVRTFQPGMDFGGMSIARLVLPQAGGMPRRRRSSRPVGSRHQG